MAKLTAHTLARVRRFYRRDTGLRATRLDRAGRLVDTAPRGTPRNNALFCRARAHALQEAVRWGEPYTFFLGPGLMTWIVPLVHDEDVRGGLSGGEVRIEDAGGDHSALINFMVSAGVSRSAAADWVARTPAWEQPRVHAAAMTLYETFYQVSGWRPALLQRHREQAHQQREIAEAIHERKQHTPSMYPIEEERILLSMIRVGDRSGARRVLNTLLAAVFLRDPRLVVLRARMIELMGYLARAAVEDSPFLEPLLEQQHRWMERILVAEDFETLSAVVRGALDDFIDSIFQQGFGRTHAKVRDALDFIREHYTENVRLDDVARHVGLSTFRIAHMVKDHTGRTIMQHIKRLRIDEARRLIETTSLSCAEVAYAVGFADQSFFTRQFREMTGTTPARYRRDSLAPPGHDRPNAGIAARERIDRKDR